MKKLCKLFLLPYLLTLETYAAISKLMTWLVADKPYDQGNVKVISNIHSADQCSDTLGQVIISQKPGRKGNSSRFYTYLSIY